MVELDRYICDGADWQSRAVLAYLQGHYETMLNSVYVGKLYVYDAQIYVGRFSNGCFNSRGYFVTVIYKWNKKQKTFAFFEHKNVEHLIVLHNDEFVGLDGITSSLFEKDYPSKYDFDKEFEFGKIVECGSYIENEIKNFLEVCKEEDAAGKFDKKDDE